MRTPKVPRMPRLSRVQYDPPHQEDLVDRAARKNPRKKKQATSGPLGTRTARPHHPEGWDPPPRGLEPRKTTSRTGGVAGELSAPAGKHRARGTAQTSRRGRHRAAEDTSYTGRHRAYEGRHRRD